MAKIIDTDDHGQPLEDIKFRLKVNKDQAEEIMSYNQLMDYIQKGTVLILTATPLTVIRRLRLPSSNPSHWHTK